MDTREIQSLADRICASAGLDTRHPATELEQLAQHLGVSSVSNRRMAEDGVTNWLAGGDIEIHIRKNQTMSRSRFTLAHELGHVLVARPEVEQQRFRALHRSRSAEERLCDAIATSLLMPRQWVEQIIESSDSHLASVLAVRAGARVSLTAAFVRVKMLAGITSSLISISQQDALWGQPNLIGDSFVVPVKLMPETIQVLNDLSYQPTERLLPIGVNGRCLAMPAETVRDIYGALVLFRSVNFGLSAPTTGPRTER